MPITENSRGFWMLVVELANLLVVAVVALVSLLVVAVVALVSLHVMPVAVVVVAIVTAKHRRC